MQCMLVIIDLNTEPTSPFRFAAISNLGRRWVAHTPIPLGILFPNSVYFLLLSWLEGKNQANWISEHLGCDGNGPFAVWLNGYIVYAAKRSSLSSSSRIWTCNVLWSSIYLSFSCPVYFRANRWQWSMEVRMSWYRIRNPSAHSIPSDGISSQ